MYFNGFLRYDRKKKSSSRLSGEKKKIQSSMYFNGFLRYDRKKKSSSHLSGEKKKIQLSVKKKVPVVCLAKKKRYSRLLCISSGFFITTGKKKFQSSVWQKKIDTVVCLLGARFWQLRPEKKKIQSSVWRVVLYVVSVFGSGGKLAVFLLRREIFITTGKKRYSRLSGGCAINYDRKKKDTVVCLLGLRFWQLREKKDTLRLEKKKIQSSV